MQLSWHPWVNTCFPVTFVKGHVDYQSVIHIWELWKAVLHVSFCERNKHFSFLKNMFSGLKQIVLYIHDIIIENSSNVSLYLPLACRRAEVKKKSALVMAVQQGEAVRAGRKRGLS